MNYDMKKTIYLDNGATTKIDNDVLKEMEPYLIENYGNASSMHHMGEKARKAIEDARKKIADALDCSQEEIYFTSGGTESNNWAIKGIAEANSDKGKHIITTKIEHDCVLNSCKSLEKKGFEVTYLDVDEDGFIDQKMLEQSIKDDTILVSIIHGNNEIGTIQKLDKIYEICKKNAVPLHTDACQSFSKTRLDSSMADLITLNAHKIHGPKGIGALFVKKEIIKEKKLNIMMHGGGHEMGMRSGTENVPAIVGFGKAVEIAMNQDINAIRDLREYFISEAKKMNCVELNGPDGEERLYNNINLSFRYIEGESIISLLDYEGICCSTGSACSSHTLDASHVIMAISDGDSERAHGSVRFTLSKYTTKEEIDFTLEKIHEAVEKLRKISPLCENCESNECK